VARDGLQLVAISLAISDQYGVHPLGASEPAPSSTNQCAPTWDGLSFTCTQRGERPGNVPQTLCRWPASRDFGWGTSREFCQRGGSMFQNVPRRSWGIGKATFPDSRSRCHHTAFVQVRAVVCYRLLQSRRWKLQEYEALDWTFSQLELEPPQCGQNRCNGLFVIFGQVPWCLALIIIW